MRERPGWMVSKVNAVRLLRPVRKRVERDKKDIAARMNRLA